GMSTTKMLEADSIGRSRPGTVAGRRPPPTFSRSLAELVTILQVIMNWFSKGRSGCVRTLILGLILGSITHGLQILSDPNRAGSEGRVLSIPISVPGSAF